MKKTKSPVKVAVTDDLKGYSLDDILTESFGPKNSQKRKSAEKKIELISSNLIVNNTLKEIREELKKTQAQIASLMDVDHSVVSKLEKNFEKAQMDTILRYAKALKATNVNISFVFEKEETYVLNFKP